MQIFENCSSFVVLEVLTFVGHEPWCGARPETGLPAFSKEGKGD